MFPDNIRLGLKLYSTNTQEAELAYRLWQEGLVAYIELYALPDSLQETLQKWNRYAIPYIIHAAHSQHGVNLAIPEMASTNRKQIENTCRFADELNAEYIIFHGGHSGNIHEVIRQISPITDERFLLENKPKVGINNEKTVGWSSQELAMAIDANAFKGTVLDFGHAACAAFSENIEFTIFIESFLALSPCMYHLAGQDLQSDKDVHTPVFESDLPIDFCLGKIHENAMVSLEIPQDFSRGLKDYEKNAKHIRDMLVS